MPLTKRVIFKAMLKERNLIYVPKLVRWQYKLEPAETLKVTVSPIGTVGVRESFLGKMHKDGRICIPKLQIALLSREEPNLEGSAIEVMLEQA